MQTFFLAFVLMLIVFGAMAIGYLLQRKSISGSCGGLGAIGVEKACDCDEPCEKQQAEMARQDKIKEWQKNQIQ